MKLRLGVFAAASVAASTTVRAADPPAPPALPPIQDPTRPTEQEADPKEMLSFVPETVATFADGTKISRDEALRPMMGQLRMAAQRGRTPTKDQLSMMVERRVEEAVNLKLLTQLCAEAGFKPDAAAAKDELAKQEEEHGSAQLNMFLQMQGLTRDDLIEQLSKQRCIDEWIQKEVLPSVKVEESEVKKFFEENKGSFVKGEQVTASHILVKTEADADATAKAAAKQEIDTVLAKLKKGEDFASLAKEHSDCPSKSRGGSLGSFGRGQMVKPFEEAAFAAKPGEVTEVVETRFGYHVILVDSHDRGGDGKLTDEIRGQIEQQLRGRGVTGIVTEKLKSARDAAGVKVMFPDKG